jgi:hypothetical protein
VKPFELSGFGFARRVDSEAIPETGHLCPGRPVFLGGRGFHGHRQADIGLACQACGSEAIARLDQIVAALPVVGAVFHGISGTLAGVGKSGIGFRSLGPGVVRDFRKPSRDIRSRPGIAYEKTATPSARFPVPVAVRVDRICARLRETLFR